MRFLAALFVLSVPGWSAAADQQIDKYLSNESVELTADEKLALEIVQQGKNNALSPLPGPNGSVRFVFGASLPRIVCAPLQLCDIALQAGEKLNAINLGDTARWTVDAALTGSGASEVQHLIVKPLDVALDTTMIVTTNRRLYSLKLTSQRAKYMPQISFLYPDDALAKLKGLETRQTQLREEQTIPTTGEYLGNLSFEYDISGDASFGKPLRVYNDGRKTIIQMPDTITQTEAPTLLLVSEPGGLFKSEKTAIVNYRLQDDRYIVDSIFDRAVLIAGVGSSQQRVTITRKKQ
jgi:type IV secretion system protein VirB9